MNIIFPGDIQGLLCPGSRGRLHIPGNPSDGAVCTVHKIEGDFAHCAVADEPVIWIVPLDWIRLDLTDATGRAHAAWWLGKCHEAAEFPPEYGQPWWFAHQKGWMLAIDFDCWLYFDSRNTPGLTGLDPDDERLLPDGSRWVNAEALRRVCMIVAGRSA